MTSTGRERPGPEAAQLSPKAFLKARRPERFSDSVPEIEPVLDRSILEYHLESITSRSQEVAFATFARHLAEREVCPNLLPQTGPTGGGDSKVDTETYPVADDLALGWYVGVGAKAASERWAFAFSAKKKWRDKVISDVVKAVEAGRGYTKIFFVSNQFIRDKARAGVEDELSKKHSVDVRILDRNWILDKVFANGNEELAIEDLQIATSARREVRKGPLDVQRERYLTEIEGRIQESLRQGRQDPMLVDECLESADVARQLELPRMEVEGRYERAERVATRCGTSRQRLRSAYERAWTAFWWFEDYELFSDLYGAAEERAEGSRNAYDLELLTNLWGLLHGSVARGKIPEELAKYTARTQTLEAELERLRRQEEQPSTALHARALQLQVQLLLRLAANQSINVILGEFREVVQSCEGLVGFPLQPLVQIIMELGEAIGPSVGYDEMFNAVAHTWAGRQSDLTVAQMMLNRGAQQIEADQPYSAIRTLGLCLRGLYKHESRADAVRALYLCGCAYERAGLLWAARGTLLSAASLAVHEFWTYGKVTHAQAACYRKLKWLELKLGRVPHALSWHQVDVATRAALSGGPSGKEEEISGEEEIAFDAILGILLLKTEHWELKWLSGLPEILDGLTLYLASVALMYALGYEDELPASFSAGPDAGGAQAFFAKWRDQPASKDLPERPLFNDEQKVILNSRLLGCDITLKSENSSPCVDLAESVLAALESLLSTGTTLPMFAREPTLTIAVQSSDFAQQPFEFTIQDREGKPHVEVLCSRFDPHSMSPGAQAQYQEALVRLLASIFARIAAGDDVVGAFQKMLRDEMALERSVCFTGSFVTVANVLGRTPKNRISQWLEPGGRAYPLRRPQAWDAGLPRPSDGEETRTKPLTMGQGEPPPALHDRGRVKQSEIRTVSLIREALWNKAGWAGTAFATTGVGSDPPIMAPIFKDRDAAHEIFRLWREELGKEDPEDRLRVAIVRGINKAKPYSYRVVIGSSPEAALRRRGTHYAVFVSRLNTMEPSSNANLERFLRSYEAAQRYILCAAVAESDIAAPNLVYHPHLMKRMLFVRQAWKIGRNDPDSLAIDVDELPIIPANEKDPPVLELLRWKRANRRPRS